MTFSLKSFSPNCFSLFHHFQLLLYNIFLSAYSFFAKVISPFNEKAKTWINGRKHVWEDLKERDLKDPVWFHCASLGEFEQALPLIEKMKTRAQVVITFFSPSGYEFVKKKYPDEIIFYLPMDSKENANHFLKFVRPKLAIFVRYDLWFYYLKALSDQQIPVFLISAAFKNDNIFFKWYGRFFLQMLQLFTHIFTQDEASKKILELRGFSEVTQAGDTRVDRVLSITKTAKDFSLIEKFKNAKKLVLIGSLEPKDESVVLPLLNDKNLSDIKFLIAPHHIHEKNLRQLSEKIPLPTLRYSQADADSALNYKIMIIDNVGMLSQIYRYADVAYIGGAFGEGLHNTLEPAAWNVPLIFGPHYEKFIEAEQLVKTKGAFVVENSHHLKTTIKQLFSDDKMYLKSKTSCAEFMEERKGATEKIWNELQKYLSQ